MPRNITSIKNIQYSTKDKRYNRLDLFFPEKSNKKLPILLNIHGGGWFAGDKKNYTRVCMATANEGYLVININYRLAPKYNYISQLIDINDVIYWIKHNCDKYNGDYNNLFLMGDSAGAHLVALTTCNYYNKKLKTFLGLRACHAIFKGIILYYGVYDLKTAFESGFPGIKSMIRSYLGVNTIKTCDFIDLISPINHITDNFPPVFITSGAIDWLHNETLSFITELKKHNIPITEMIFPADEKEAQHVFQLFYKRNVTQSVFTSVIQFMKHNTNDS